MKKWKNAKKIVVLSLAWFFLFLLFQNTAFAAGSETEKAITPGKMKEWDDGVNVTQESSGKGKDYQMSVTADTSGLEEGYYSFYLYDYTTRSVKPNDGIRFNLKNESDTELKINLTITVNSKVNVTMADSSFAILESADQSMKEVVYLTYGTLSIPANFDGTVYVPFTQLYTEDGENIPLLQIQSWGITTNMSQEQQAQFTVGNICFLTKSIDSVKDSYFLFSTTGNSEITVPTTGTVMEIYQVEVKDIDGNHLDDDIIFSLEDNIAGAWISKDGKLEVGSDCVASEVTVCVKTNKSINSGKLKIKLEQVSAVVAASGIAKASDVKGITTLIYSKMNEYMKVIRVLLFILVLVFVFIFYEWFLESKNNYDSIKNKLFKSFNEQEEEEK